MPVLLHDDEQLESAMQRGHGANGVRHVLVVDDDVCLRRSLQLRLEGAGYQVYTAGAGRDGVTLFDENGADLIILDIKMPDLDGFEVCKFIKQHSDVPIIFLTGAQNELIRDYLPQMVDAVGGDYFLRKPFDAKLLMQLVRDILER